MNKMFCAMAISLLIFHASPILSSAEQIDIIDTETLKNLDEQIRQYPSDPSLYNSRANVYERLGRTSEAEVERKKAKKLEQKNTNAPKQLSPLPPLNIVTTQPPAGEVDKPQNLSLPKEAEVTSSEPHHPPVSDTKEPQGILQATNGATKSFSMGGFIAELKEQPLLLIFISGMLVAGFSVHFFAFTTKSVAYGPTIFTTFGIFATFLGIALGLFSFDVNNVQNSIPELLKGLKMAFWASVFGVGIALTLKMRFAIWGASKESKERITGATIDDLFDQMKAVQQAIIGNDDSTLLSQLKLTRQDANDRLDALRRSQEAFMEKMAENNSKALIEALKEVIKDFNTKINEQFGENFKQLNQAVEKILVWQERYKNQIAEMIEQQTVTTSNMTIATSRYTELLDKMDKFNTVADRLTSIIETLDVQRKQIEQSLTSLGQLLISASGSLPAIERKIIDLTEQMTKGVRDSNEIIRNTMTDIQNKMSETTAALQSAMKNMIDSTQKNSQEINTRIEEIMKKTQEQVAKLDKALEEELTKSLKSLANQLTSLSAQFAKDYTPLTQELRKLIESLGRR